MQYTFAQTFYIDKAAVKNSPSVLLTGVKLFFKRKPKATNNRSGINNPGVVIGISETDGLYSPDAERILKGSTIRVNYENITAMADASVGTSFTFDAPISTSSDKFYAIVIKFEDPDFELWQNVQGDRLVNTNTPSPGASGTSDGKFYQYNNYSAPLPLNNSDLKYQVFVAKFTTNNINIDLVPRSNEFIKHRYQNKPFLAGEFVYQDHGGFANGMLNPAVTFYARGKINVSANSTTITGTSDVGFVTNGIAADDYIVITDGTLGNTDVIQVSQIVSNTSLNMYNAPSFTANNVFYKKTVVARHFTDDKASGEAIFYDSTANATSYFTNTSIHTISLDGGGTLYSNSDVLVVSGGGSTVNATANVITNGSGVIVGVNFSNVGIGFTSTPTITVTTGTGSGASFTPYLGSAIRSRSSRGTLLMEGIVDRRTKFIKPKIGLNLPSGSKAKYTMNFANSAYHVDGGRAFGGDNDIIKEVYFDSIIASRSNEVLNGTNLFTDGKGRKRSGRINVNIDTGAIGDSFTSPLVFDKKLELLTMKAIINNDITGEETKYGNALCKHITKRVTFGEGKSAEDLKIYINAYRPPNTDIKIYAKVHNSRDPEPFDDKFWSLLEMESGESQVSNPTDQNDMREYGYGLTSYPTLDFTLGGVVTTNGSANIVGVGTAFNADINVDDLVRIYDPVFPENYDIGVVASRTNDTTMSLYEPLTNINVNSTSGLKVDKIKHKYSVFNNTSGDNVSRYFNSTMVPYDKFDSYSIKIVLLSSDGISIPRVDDIRSLGVSA